MLAERWNGTSWVIQPNPAGANGIVLSAVSCTGAAACTAVGGAGTATLAERWNGSSWVIQHMPTPSGANGSGLSSVSCTAVTACTAVGSYIDSSATSVTLAERYSG
jgi:hypothetical protein